MIFFSIEWHELHISEDNLSVTRSRTLTASSYSCWSSRINIASSNWIMPPCRSRTRELPRICLEQYHSLCNSDYSVNDSFGMVYEVTKVTKQHPATVLRFNIKYKVFSMSQGTSVICVRRCPCFAEALILLYAAWDTTEAVVKDLERRVCGIATLIKLSF